MSTCYPALRGKFGRTEYFLTAMPVGELVGRMKFPAEMPEWEGLSIEERYQRTLDMGRIRRELAPYFANDDRRFSGSLVLAVHSHERMVFERLSELGVAQLPSLYMDAASDVGFVTMQGQEVLVPLDGQHRAKAFQMAMDGYSDGAPSRPLKPSTGLARDTVAVILVRFEGNTPRYIFNKINRYARPTAKADKLITDDDDAVAVITRRLITDNVIPARLVNISTNILTAKAHEFTTLAALYEANKKLIAALDVPSTSRPEKMDERERGERLAELAAEWRRLLSGIGAWRKAVKDPGEGGDRGRASMRKKSILGRPVGQISLINGYALACMKDRDRADRDGLVAKLDRVDWGMGAPEWRGLLVKLNGKIMASKSASNNAGIIIAHRIGAKLTDRERDRALKFVHGTSKGHKLPSRVQLPA